MARASPRSLSLTLGWVAFALALALVLVPAAPVQAKEWESAKDNVVVSIPEGVNAWDWLPYDNAWSKLGIVKAAERRLQTLKGGEAANGHGAVMYVAVRPAKEGTTLESLRDDDDVRSFLLKRFDGKNGEVEVEQYTVRADVNGDHPCLVFRTEGQAFNLKGKLAKAEGILLATIARGKLHLVSLFAFPTEYDPEGLAVDINYLEGNGFALITAKEEDKKTGKEGPPPKEDGDAGKAEDAPKEEERKDEELLWADLRCRLVRDKKLLPQEITDEDREFNLIFKCADSDTHGSYVLYIYAPPTVAYIDGVAAPPADILKWITVDWYNHFTNTHPKGELATYEWPRKPETKGAVTFMTIPDLDDEKARQVVFKDDEKRPAEVSSSDMIKKFGFCEKVKKNNIGKKGKAIEAVRGCMSGKNALDSRIETVFRWAFRYGASGNSYRVFVTFNGEGYRKWGPAIRKTLESWEFGIKD